MKKAICLIINVVIASLIVSCNTRIEEQEILGTWESLDYHFTFEFLPDSLCVIHNVPDTMLWLFPNEVEVPDLNHRTTVNAKWYIGKDVNGYDGIIVRYISEYQEYGPRVNGFYNLIKICSTGNFMIFFIIPYLFGETLMIIQNINSDK